MGPPSEKTVEKLFEERISGRTSHLDYILRRLPTIDSGRLYQLCTEVKTHRKNTIIHLGSVNGETEAIRQVLDKLSDTERVRLLKQKNDWGRTAFHCAAMFNQAETLQCELDKIPQEERFELLRIQDSVGYTALHSAAENGHSDIIQCLINSLSVSDRFQLLQIQNVASKTALRIAVTHNHTETAKFIIILSADVLQSPNHHPELVQILTNLNVGSEINTTDIANHDQSLPTDEFIETQQIVEKLGDQITLQATQVGNLTQNLDDKEHVIIKLDSKVENQEQEIKKLTEKAEHNSQTIKQLSDQVEAQEKNIYRLNKQADEYSRTLVELEERDNAETKEIEKLKEQDKIKMKRIEEMAERITRHDNILAELEKKMEEHGRAFGKLQKNLQQQEEATKELGEIQALHFDQQADINKAHGDETKQLKHCVEDHQFPPSGYLDDQVQDD